MSPAILSEPPPSPARNRLEMSIFLVALESRLTRRVFEAWFGSIQLHAFEDTTAVFSLPTKFLVERASKYTPEVIESVREQCGTIWKARFILREPAPYVAPAKPEPPKPAPEPVKVPAPVRVPLSPRARFIQERPRPLPVNPEVPLPDTPKPKAPTPKIPAPAASSHRPSIALIQQVVCEKYSITMAELTGSHQKGRDRQHEEDQYTKIRRIAWYLARLLTRLPVDEVGPHFNRSGASIHMAAHYLGIRQKKELAFAKEVEVLIDEIYRQLPKPEAG